MSGIAFVAANGAVASGLGISLPHISPSAIDGFAAGTMLSGLLVLLVMAPRRLGRLRGTSARAVAWPITQPNPMTPNLSNYAALASSAAQARATSASAFPALAALRYLPALAVSDPFDEAAEVVVSLPRHPEGSQSAAPTASGKHRQYRADATARQPSAKRHCGRHAAPPIGVTNRMAGRLALSPLPLPD